MNQSESRNRRNLGISDKCSPQVLNLHRTIIRVIDCPRCDKPQATLVNSAPAEWACPRCGNVVVRAGRVPETLWRLETANAIDCKCGTEVVLTDDNLYQSPSGGLWYLCPNRAAHGSDAPVVAVRFKDSWLPPTCFFRRSDKNGLVIPSDSEDFIALDLIMALAQVEHSEFNTLSPGGSSKLLWHDDSLIGYFVYTNEPEGVPTLNQLYVSPQHRRHGFGTSMIDDFLKMFPNGPVAIEVPLSDEAGRILAKFNLAEQTEGAFKPSGRARFVAGPF